MSEPSAELIFGKHMESRLTEQMIDRDKAAKKLNICTKTLGRRFKKPGDMTLGELKTFIRLYGASKDAVLQYLYENK
ncbi:MAG: hypothetical protein IJ335_06445 [Lachnospiraceae bacterium]|nr:hypothetical protein [Lachnospiraceae bacterium]